MFKNHWQDANMADQAARIRERIAALQATDADPLAEARAEVAFEKSYREA